MQLSHAVRPFVVALTLAVAAGCTSSAATSRTTSPPLAPVPTTAPAGSAGDPTAADPTSADPTAADPTAIRTADPSRYHVGTLGPGSPRRVDPDVTSFTTPSGNIRCTSIAAAQVTCEIGSHTFAAAPRPEDCDLNWLGSTVTLDARGARLGICAGNPVVQSGSAVLPYGSRIELGSVQCVTSSEALTCSGPTHGFTLSRGGVTVR